LIQRQVFSSRVDVPVLRLLLQRQGPVGLQPELWNLPI